MDDELPRHDKAAPRPVVEIVSFAQMFVQQVTESTFSLARRFIEMQ
jgi:hypothetical protein